jgi:hypothetical protein
MAKIYKSKIDTWVFALVGVAMAMSAYVGVTVMVSGTPDILWTGFLTIGLGIVLPLWLLFSTRYTLDASLLTVRSGPLKWKIPVGDIISITPTRSIFSSPALSMDRLRISYGNKRSLMISPRDKEQFLQDIQAFRSHAG